jgi:16S rRNA C967 or C1407 C5-methylase (RsmB/RsmF family)
MIKFCIGINDDIEEMEECLLILQNTINLKKEQEAKKKLEMEQLRKPKRVKKSVNELLQEINDELQDWSDEKDEAEIRIDELTIKKDELEKRLEPVIVPKKRGAPKKVSLEKQERKDFEGTVKFLIDETAKRSQMDKEMFSV